MMAFLFLLNYSGCIGCNCIWVNKNKTAYGSTQNKRLVKEINLSTVLEK